MSASWNDLIPAQPAAALPLNGPSLCVAGHLSVLALRGPDAASFLQGQVTADVREVSQGHSRLAMHLSLKGRGLASARLLPAEDGIDLLVPAVQAARLQQCLGKYMIFSRATLTPMPEQAVLVLWDPQEASLAATLSALDLPCPTADQVVAQPPLTVARLDACRTLLTGPVSHLQTLWPALSRDRSVGGVDAARWCDLQAGEVHVLPDTEDLFLPQALNYDALGGVSFRKGCYTGQEIVARMHFKGEMKQRLQGFAWKADQPTPPGTVLRNAAGRAVGEVADALALGPLQQVLAVVRLDHEGDLYRQQDETLVPLSAQRLELPYPLPAR